MGSLASKEQLVSEALENQDIGELRTLLKDLSPDQIRDLCKSYVPSDENQCTILHYATWQDNPELLAPLLDYADDLEVRDGLGWTPLMTAVNRGSKKNINMLLARGAQVDCDWTGGMSLIADAMNHNDIELITILIDRGARVSPSAEMLANGQDQTAFCLLHYAADDGLLDIAKLLIEKGKVPLNTLDASGWSPLHLASGHNNSEIVSLLLSKGADVNVHDSHGNTPLAWAREMSATDVIKELEKHGGTADKEWKGDKLELKTQTQHTVDETKNGEQDHDAEEQEFQGANKDGSNGRFEIEVEDAKVKRQTSTNGKDSSVLDGLQRQRPPARAVF